MPALKDLLAEGSPVSSHRPWPRTRLEPARWSFAIAQLAEGNWTLMGLWGERGPSEPDTVHMALLDDERGTIGVVSVACEDGRYPSVARFHPPAIRLERALRDLFGLEPEGLPDTRPWLDHGRWGVIHPMGAARPRVGEPPAYDFLGAEGEALHQVAVGPIHAGIIEPGHFRFTASGETLVRVEERLGYTHKGVESLMEGADLAHGARLANRRSGDATVAYAIAFARAAEAASGAEAPPRAVALRALMAEIERLANHLGDIGGVCNDASFALMLAECGILRERCLRAADTAFGHRLMRDRVVPGGVLGDLDVAGAGAIRALLLAIRKRFPTLVELYDTTASLQDRTVGTGILGPALARQYGAGGHVGRASGRDFDSRKVPGYAPYERLDFTVPVLEAGDVDARVWIRIREVEQSLGLVDQLLATLPDGPTLVDLPLAEGEGMALVESFRGDVMAWLRLGADGRIARCHLRDPSWFQWPLLEAAIEGNIIADFPICNKSFNCSYSGHDL